MLPQAPPPPILAPDAFLTSPPLGQEGSSLGPPGWGGGRWNFWLCKLRREEGYQIPGNLERFSRPKAAPPKTKQNPPEKLNLQAQLGKGHAGGSPGLGGWAGSRPPT